ncbi:speckle-type POZ protein-like B [Phymastichus coffea]|uniref:speckle-type POZ protein-like B n=1 Tax=Phymastichus coffea TaxID=108790 RepID=UPI00273C0850|nr:speckle-type POZ protein-like B [Phymastichus coffea]
MSITRRTGEMIKVSHFRHSNMEYEYIWLIKDFINCYNVSGFGHAHESPPIFIGFNYEYEWTLDIYVAGYNLKNVDYIGIVFYLWNKEKHKDKKFTVEISILDQDHERHFTRKAILFHENISKSDGIFEDFVLRSDLWNRQELLSNNELKIACKICIGEANTRDKLTEVQYAHNYSEEILKKLFDNRQFSDFKIIVEKREFRVHRAILAAISPVFHAMFESKMRESNEGRVHIEDVEADVIEKTLYFIYVGKLNDIEDLADKVLAVAEKYQLESLKQRCEYILVKQLNLDNVYDTLLLADKNNANELKKQTIQFFLKNAEKLFTEEMDFKTSVAMLPINLQTEIICTFVSKL